MFDKIKLLTIIILLIFVYKSVSSQTLNSPSNIIPLSANNLSEVIINDTIELNEEEILERKKLIQNEYVFKNDLENFYSKRANENLTLQGYEFFKNSSLMFSERINTVNGSRQDDYIINPGDEIIIVFQGGRNQNIKQSVQRDGMLYLDFTTPISAVGRSLKELKKEIISRVKNSLVETSAYISLGRVNSITVNINGEVILPGVYNVNPFSSLIDILLKAGGIKKSGSLRKIKIINRQGTSEIDLYDYLFGLSETFQIDIISNKTTIIVPPIGETVAASGNFSKKGIYEIIDNKNTVHDLVRYARKYSLPGNIKLTRNSLIGNTEKNSYSKVNINDYLKSGDIIFSYFTDMDFEPSVELLGAVKNPGVYPFSRYGSLSKLTPNINHLNEDSYNLSVLIQRYDEKTLKYKFLIKNLNKFFNKKQDIKLRANDKIYFFSNSNIEFLSSKIMYQAYNINYSGSCKLINEFSKKINVNNNIKLTYLDAYFKSVEPIYSNFSGQPIPSDSSFDNYSGTGYVVVNESEFSSGTENENDCKKVPDIFVENPFLLIEIFNHLVDVRGSIDRPGLYLFDYKQDVMDLINFTGSSNNSFILSPDKKTVDVGVNTVKIDGAIKYPSFINISTELFLSNIIKNENYFLRTTHPFFALIVRKSKRSGIQKLISFNPSLITTGFEDIKLQPSDSIIFFRIDDLHQIKDYYKETLVETVDPIDVLKTANDNELKTKKLDLNMPILIEDNLSIINSQYKEEIDINDLATSSEENTNIKTSPENNQTILDNKPLLKNCSLFPDVFAKSKSLCSRLFDILKASIIYVEGGVNSPNLYFVGDYVDVNEVINYAGGFAYNAEINNVEVSNASANLQNSNFIYPGGRVFVNSRNLYKNEVKLVGSIQNERTLSFKPNLRLSDFFKSFSTFTKDAYLFFGTIKRSDYSTNTSKLIPFSPIDVVEGKQDVQIKPGDIINVYTNDQINNLINTHNIHNEIQTPELEFDANTNLPLITGDIPILIKSLSIQVEGSVVKPGKVLVASSISLEKLIEIRGGLNNETNYNAEIVFSEKDNINNYTLNSRYVDIRNDLNIKVFPGSLVRFPKSKNDLSLGYVQILGAVNQPGEYRILRGDTIFSLLKRSGGLSDNAYLKGLVFTRTSEKNREKNSIKRLKRELEKAVLVALENQSSSNRVNLSDISALRELIISANTFEPIGRVIGDFDNIEALKNTSVVSGDKISIPQKPNSITVIGEVMSPGSILWDSKSKANSYIQKAAGFTELAERKKVFVIAPNGQASSKGGLWSTSNILLPGSTIVVPRRIQLASVLDRVSAITSVIYQLTVTLAGIDNLLND